MLHGCLPRTARERVHCAALGVSLAMPAIKCVLMDGPCNHSSILLLCLCMRVYVNVCSCCFILVKLILSCTSLNTFGMLNCFVVMFRQFWLAGGFHCNSLSCDVKTQSCHVMSMAHVAALHRCCDCLHLLVLLLAARTRHPETFGLSTVKMNVLSFVLLQFDPGVNTANCNQEPHCSATPCHATQMGQWSL